MSSDSLFVYDHWALEDPTLIRNAPSSSTLAARIVEASGAPGGGGGGGGGVGSAIERDAALYYGHAPLPGHMLSRSAFLNVHKVPPREHIANQHNRSLQPPGHVGAFENLFDSHGRWVESAIPPSDDLHKLLQLSNDSGGGSTAPSFIKPPAKWKDSAAE